MTPIRHHEHGIRVWCDSNEDAFPFTLIDGSWHPLLYGRLLKARLAWCSLYQGATAAEHLHDAPLLIALEKGDDMIPWLAEQAHGLVCGIFGTASIAALRSAWPAAMLHYLAEMRVHGHFSGAAGIEDTTLPHPLLLLRMHFRRFTRVLTEDGSERQFRFYDPDVLSIWLRHCTATELVSVFGPVQAFFTEAQNGVRRFSLAKHPPRLITAEVEIPL